MKLPKFIVRRLRSWAYREMGSREPNVTIHPEVPGGYMQRWWVINRNKYFNIYLHKINHSDDDRALHNHPWLNLSVVLENAYEEHTQYGVFIRTEGQVVGRLPGTYHRLEIPGGSYTVSLFITGPVMKEWGFLCPQGFRHWKDFTSPTDKYSIGRGCD